MNLQNLKNRALQNQEVKTEYEKLDSEFQLIDSLLTIRKKAGLTQKKSPAKWVLKKAISRAWKRVVQILAGRPYRIMRMLVGTKLL